MLPASSHPSVVQITSVFWMGQGRIRHLWQCPNSWVCQALSHMLSLSPTGERVSWYSAVLPWQVSDARQLKIFLLPSSVSPISNFFLQQYTSTPSLDSQTPTKVLLSVGDCQNWCSLGRIWYYAAILLTVLSILSFLEGILTAYIDDKCMKKSNIEKRQPRD